MRLILLCIVTIGTATPLLNARQNSPSLSVPAGKGPSNAIGKVTTQYTPTKIEQLRPNDARPGVKRLRLTFGPLELRPANYKRAPAPKKMDPNSDAFNGMATGIPTGVLVLATNTSLTYADGSIADVVNGVYNHHLIFSVPQKMGPGPLKCTDSTEPAMRNMGLLMGASEANRDLQFSPGAHFDAGFNLAKSADVAFSAELVNYTNETKQIYTVTDFEYMEKSPKDALDSSMNVFDINMCTSESKDIAIPHGQTKWSMTSKRATVARDGFILFRRGHMHDGGDSVDLLLNGKNICVSKAVYGGDGATTVIEGKKWETISKMEACTDPVKVKAGDILEVAAHIDLDAHPARQHSHGAGMGEQMGLMTFMYAPEVQ